MVTDTGSFRYPGRRRRPTRSPAGCWKPGIAFDAIAREVFDGVPFGYLGVLGHALESARLEPEAANGCGLVWTAVPAADRVRRGLPFDLVEPIIDVVRKAAEAEVAMVLKEDDIGELRVSMRSKGSSMLERWPSGSGAVATATPRGSPPALVTSKRSSTRAGPRSRPSPTCAR